MTNPADVLTDEFIGRVASAASKLAFWGFDSKRTVDDRLDVEERIRFAVETALQDEREPIQTLIFEVRGATREDAVKKFAQAASVGGDWLWCRRDIRLKDEP